jgi:hypothetical protein
MIPRNLSGDSAIASTWQELDSGASTISAFAELCKRAIIDPPDTKVDVESLSDEAKTVLISGAPRGVVDIRACKDDYDSVERFLAICVEQEPDSRLLFLRKEDPIQTVAFLEGFAQLCRNGLVIHHLGRDFSFSKAGYSLATLLVESGVADSLTELLAFAEKLDH